jgi:hypothetical protein
VIELMLIPSISAPSDCPLGTTLARDAFEEAADSRGVAGLMVVDSL